MFARNRASASEKCSFGTQLVVVLVEGEEPEEAEEEEEEEVEKAGSVCGDCGSCCWCFFCCWCGCLVVSVDALLVG